MRLDFVLQILVHINRAMSKVKLEVFVLLLLHVCISPERGRSGNIPALVADLRITEMLIQLASYFNEAFSTGFG